MAPGTTLMITALGVLYAPDEGVRVRAASARGGRKHEIPCEVAEPRQRRVAGVRYAVEPAARHGAGVRCKEAAAARHGAGVRYKEAAAARRVAGA